MFWLRLWSHIAFNRKRNEDEYRAYLVQIARVKIKDDGGFDKVSRRTNIDIYIYMREKREIRELGKEGQKMTRLDSSVFTFISYAFLIIYCYDFDYRQQNEANESSHLRLS